MVRRGSRALAETLDKQKARTIAMDRIEMLICAIVGYWRERRGKGAGGDKVSGRNHLPDNEGDNVLISMPEMLRYRHIYDVSINVAHQG